MSAPAPAPSSTLRPSRGGGAFQVLIVRTGAMGDVLHAMPAVAAMRRLHPEWEIGWAIEPRWQPLLRSTDGTDMPLVNRVHEVPTRAWNQHPLSITTLDSVLGVRRELLDGDYDLCVDMQGLVRSAVVGRFAHATEYAGFARPREGVARWFYSHRIATTAPHVIDRGCELLGIAIGEKLCATQVTLPRDGIAERWCGTFLAEFPLGAKLAMLAPTAGWGAKQWPVERYGEMASRLSAMGYIPLVNAAKEHDAVAAAVKETSGGCAVPVVCNIAQLIALMRRICVMVAGDTGPLHLAAALGCPVVGLYGPTDPRRTGPYGAPSEVVRHVSSSVDHRRHPEPEKGLAQITVDEVTQAVERVTG